MYPIDTDSAVSGAFVGGDPSANPVVRATELDAGWANRVQGEIIGAVESAFIGLDKSDNAQLFKAIRKIAFRGWRRYYAGAAYATIAAFKAAAYYPVGVHQSYRGEIFNTGNYYQESDRRSVLYEMTIHIPAAAGYSFSFPPPVYVDDAAYLAVDAAEYGALTAWTALTLAQGDHVISVMNDDTAGSYYGIILPEWIDEKNILYAGNGVFE